VGKDTKADFETRLSAANSGSNNGYNIQEIKEDALWLSNETQIDEVSALRIVVLEYQSRPEAQLRNNFSVEEGASLQAAAGDINTESSNLLQSALKSTALAFTGNEASEQEKRRLRSVHIYFSERQNLLACSKLLYHIGFRRTEQKGKGVATTPQWIDRISEEFVRNQDESPERYVHYIIVQVQRLFASLEKGSSGWFKSIGGREDVEAEWANMRLAEITHALEILLVVLDRRRFDTRSGDNVRSWFQLAMSIGFFEGQSSPDPTFQHSIYSIQGLIAAISLSILDISNTVDHILEDSDALADVQHYYVHDIQTLGEVHKMITEMALSNSRIGSPAILAWAVMLYTMQNVVQMRLESPETPVSENAPAYKLYVDFLDSITPRDLHNKAAEPLAMYAVDEAKVFDILRDLAISFGASSGPDLHSGLDCRVRISILDLIARSGGHVMYSAEVVDAVLAALEGDSGYWDVATKGAGLADENPTAYFLQNNLLVEQVLNVAAARFPYEDLPFLKLVRALATCERYDTDGVPAVMKVLDVLPSFTAQLPDDFDSYETIDEDTALNDIRLTDDFPLFEVRPNLGLIYKRGSRTMAPGLRQIEENFTIPAYTPGRIIVESLPRVALFFHQYSCINYVGKLLETGMAPAEYFDALTQQRASREVLVEIISILASLVSTSVRINEASGGVGDSNGCAKTILEQAGRELDRNRDVVSVVSLIFEEELEHQADGSSPDNSLDLLIACLQFFHALLPVVPGRVWPVLARSGLLDKDGRPGRLRSIITSVELVSARYDFLLSCVHLFSELVEDCASHAVLRKVSLNKAANRHDDDDNLGTGVPEHVVPKALLAYTATLLDVYETACNWKYAIPSHRLLIARSISTVFEKLIYYTYGVGETPSAGSKLTSSLHESARFLIDRFLSPTAGPLRFQPLFRGLLDGFMTPELTVNTSYFLLWTSQVEAILKLTQTLVKAGTVLGKNDSHLRGQLFSVSPLIARLYAKYDSYRLSVVTLLRSLVVASASGSEEPPSLLGHLGQETSTNFLSILTRMGKPFKDDNHIIPVWQLLSAVVSNRQQWFAIYILTGSKPRDALKNAEDKSKSEISKPFLDVALEELSNINNIPIERAIAILEFISLAQNYWPWAMLDIQNKSTIITSIADFVSGLEVLSQSANDEKSIRGAKEARVAAYVAEILAMHLYHCRQTGNTSQVKDVLAKLQYYRRCAASPPLYNSSLHGNLAKNFTTRFAGTSTHDFKRSAITQKDIGPDYYYDLGLARKMLCFSPAWKGKKDDGNGQELVKANINLSVVDAQIVSFILMCSLHSHINERIGSTAWLENVGN
jgi:nuclear pore complex protein Nup188